MTTRIGLVTDTHAPEYLPGLPPGLLDALRGVDLIFHLGDITGPEVIAQLEALAPVHAVRGNHDPLLTPWPLRTVVEVDGWRFGLVHGNGFGFGSNLLLAGINALIWRWRFFAPGYVEKLVDGFAQPVDFVISGHIHRPLHAYHRGIEIYSPGAVYMPSPPLLRWARAHNWRPSRRGWVQEILLRVPTPIPRPAVGLAQVDRTGVRFERIELTRFRGWW